MAILQEFKCNDDEHLIFKEHRHWIIFVSRMWKHTILYIVLTIGLFWLWLIWDRKMEKLIGLDADFILWVNIVFFVIMTFFYGLRFSNQWIDWFYDVLVLTDKRLIEVNQKFLFGRETKVLPLEQVTSVMVHHKGVLGTLLKFGDVIAESASISDNDIYFSGLPNHEDLQNKINNARNDRSKILRQMHTPIGNIQNQSMPSQQQSYNPQSQFIQQDNQVNN